VGYLKNQITTQQLQHTFLLSCLVFVGYTLHDEQGVCHTVALPFTLKAILRQKKN
jgi:hypothetical protein